MAPIALPLSILTSIVGAAGASCLFAALYYGLSAMMNHTDELSLSVLRNYVFIFVFSASYTSLFTAKKLTWQGGKSWDVSLTLFLLFYLTAYLLRFWPQSPQLAPEFTVRAFIWYCGALGFTMAVEHYGTKYNACFQSDIEKIYRVGQMVFSFGAIPLLAALLYATTTGQAGFINGAFFWVPVSIVALGSIFYALSHRREKFIVVLARILFIYFAFAWSFLLMPVLLVVERFVSDVYPTIFAIESWQMYVSVACFAIVSLAALIGPILAKLIPDRKASV